ncbi:Spectrin beta chain, non-erythrocytic 1 [Goodea atripinnis]|uniref:Spectrin beta chain, non-erythrocytic 1 n=1 Tax=Goodea atripinnis TaxID=208336 RepID=A0ABV0PRJ5_9TELE
MTSVAAEYDHMEIQQQISDGVNNRWDADDWDNENSSARLFERSRIKALAARVSCLEPQIQLKYHVLLFNGLTGKCAVRTSNWDNQRFSLNDPCLQTEHAAV